MRGLLIYDPILTDIITSVPKHRYWACFAPWLCSLQSSSVLQRQSTRAELSFERSRWRNWAAALVDNILVTQLNSRIVLSAGVGVRSWPAFSRLFRIISGYIWLSCGEHVSRSDILTLWKIQINTTVGRLKTEVLKPEIITCARGPVSVASDTTLQHSVKDCDERRVRTESPESLSPGAHLSHL